MKVPPKRARRAVWGGFFILILLAAAYYTWLALSVRSDLQAMQKQAGVIKSSLISGNNQAASQALERFSSAAEDAQSHTNSLGWKALGVLPWIGTNTKAVATVSDIGVDVAANAVAPVLDEAQGNVMKQFQPRDGRIDLTVATKLQPTMARVDASLSQAASKVDAINTRGLFGSVSGPLAKLRAELDGARAGADAAYRASRLMPSMLGGSGTRRYLLMFDNNAEIRATGGMPGAWAIVTADAGKITLTQQGTADQLAQFPQPVLPQSSAEQAIYGGQIASFFQDTNFTPEFSRTADLVQAMWQQHFGTRLDGVLSVDAVSLGEFLKATGPVVVDGVTLTSTNAADELLNGAYLRFPNSADQYHLFFRTAAAEIFHKLTTAASPTELAKALAAAVDQGRVYLHSFHASEQQILGTSQIAGPMEFASTKSPQLGVYLNDATGSKMSYYLRTSVSAKAMSCSSGAQQIDGSAVFSMIKPTGTLNKFIVGGGYGTAPGQQTVLVRIYGPVGGSFKNWRFDGQPMDSDVVVDRGRPVSIVAVQLGPDGAGYLHRITWTATSGPNQTGNTVLQVTPGMVSRSAEQQIPSACH